MEDRAQPEDRFKKTFMEFLELLRDLVEDCCNHGHDKIKPWMIDVIIQVIKDEEYVCDRKKVIENFIRYSYKDWDRIRLRDQSYFIENAVDIFRDLPLDQLGDHINAFKLLFTACDRKGRPIIGSEDREDIWDFLDSMIKISFAYLHAWQQPYSKQTDKGVRRGYRRKFFPDMNLKEFFKRSQDWDVSLEYPKPQND